MPPGFFSGRSVAVVLLAVIFGWAADTHAVAQPEAPSGPSFNCARAALPVEIAICNDTGLSRLDRQMAGLYAQLERSTTAVGRGMLQQRQREWLARRNACGAGRTCIAAAYTTAISRLQRDLDQQGGPGTAGGGSPPVQPPAGDSGGQLFGSITEAGDTGTGMAGEALDDEGDSPQSGLDGGTGTPAPGDATTRTVSAYLYDHNGSEMLLEDEDGKVTITYRRPKSSLTSLGVRSGTVLFEGWRDGGVLAGEARTFRSGCPNAHYIVEGVDRPAADFTLAGAAPVRGPDRCSVARFDPQSSNAVLGFRFLRKLY